MEKNVSNHPILIMIGGMRCGTRALQRYLSQHPQILPHQKAHDPNFFSSAENWAKGIDHYLRGWSEFDPAKHRYRFESSTHYTKYPNVPNVPERMHESGLEFQFVYGVRDPLMRIESHLQHNAGKGYFDPSDPERRRRFLKTAINYSRYDSQLERFEQIFRDKQIFVYTMESLLEEPESVLGPLSRFLELDTKFSFKPVKRIGTRFTVPVDNVRLTDAEKARIVKILEPEISEFMARFNIDPSTWPVWKTARDEQSSALQERVVAPAAPAVRRSYSGAGRFAFLTVDTEALPKRAVDRHVEKLIWGEFDNGTAGIREMAEIGNEFGAKHIFFIDMCETILYGEKINSVVRWLNESGQDVQLHTHPELLPADFWDSYGFPATPKMMNRYEFDKALFVLSHFSSQLESLTGQPVRAFRAGSFRWNANTIRAMANIGIGFSFNDTLRLHRKGRNPFSSGNSEPYRWENGVVEFPLTERDTSFGARAAFVFPANIEGDNDPHVTYHPFIRGPEAPKSVVLLLHSWSLLHWDSEGRAEYRGDQRQSEYRQLLKQLSQDYDIVTTDDLESSNLKKHLGSLSKTKLRMAEKSRRRTMGVGSNVLT